MANTFLTAKQIARNAMIRLQNNRVFSGVVFTDFKDVVKKEGAIIQVLKPAIFDAEDFDRASGVTISAITEQSADVVLDKILNVSVDVTSEEMSMSIEDFGEQIIQGMVDAIADRADYHIAQLYKDIPHFSGTSGTTPNTLALLSAAVTKLNKNKAPNRFRRGVVDPDAQGALLAIDALASSAKSGSTEALREASMGRIYGMDTFMDQNIAQHTMGAYGALTDLTSNGIQAIAATTFNVESAAGASTAVVKEGDIFTIETGSAKGQYVVTADSVAAIAGAVALSIYPGLRGATADTDTVAFADESAGSHIANLVFQKNAFAMAVRPLALPMDSTEESAYRVNFDNLSLRVTYGYDHDKKKEVLSVDMLCGFKTLYPELAVRMLG